MYSNETIQKFIALRSEGKSYAGITQEIGVAKNTLINWNKKYGANLKHQAHDRLLDYNLLEADAIRAAQIHISEIKIPLRQSIKYDLHEFASIPLIQRIRLLITLNKEDNRLSDRERKLLTDLPNIIDKCPGPIDEEVHPPVPDLDQCEDETEEDNQPLTLEEQRALRASLGLSRSAQLVHKLSNLGPEILGDLLGEDDSAEGAYAEDPTALSGEAQPCNDDDDYEESNAAPAPDNITPLPTVESMNQPEPSASITPPTENQPVQKKSNFGPISPNQYP